MNKFLVFQSDFGLVDGAVSAMEGVAYAVDPDLKISHVTHDITPYNIFEGSYRLFQTVYYWPEGTVFVSVVDPGVGSKRKSVVAKTKHGHYIVTPDNGTLTHIHKFFGIEELREILDRVQLSSQMGVCLDTCHVWDGGYDIVHHLDEVLTEFDRVIGLGRLKAIHLNNSQNDLGAHKDRHARLAEGKIPLEALVRIINHPALRHLPFYLETPNELPGYKEEIHLMRRAYKEI